MPDTATTEQSARPVPAGRPLPGRTVLVTGSGSGLGRAIALRLSRGGAAVVVGDVRLAAARQTVALIEEGGGTASAVEMDVSNSAATDAVIGELFDRHGDAFDGLVNNAGTDRGAGLLDVTDELWDKVIGVNQCGPLWATRAFLRRVVERGERVDPVDVVNVTSTSAITVGTDSIAYNTSKAAALKLTQLMQREAHEYRWPARIHGLMPSAMNTPMMEQWNLSDDVMMDPDTVARAVEFMLTLPSDTFVQNLVIN